MTCDINAGTWPHTLLVARWPTSLLPHSSSTAGFMQWDAGGQCPSFLPCVYIVLAGAVCVVVQCAIVVSPFMFPHCAHGVRSGCDAVGHFSFAYVFVFLSLAMVVRSRLCWNRVS